MTRPPDDYAEFESCEWAEVRRREDEQALEAERDQRCAEYGPAWFAGTDDEGER